jgi:hypothetical protein
MVTRCRPRSVRLIHGVARLHISILVPALERGVLWRSSRLGFVEALVSVFGLFGCSVHGGRLALCGRYHCGHAVAVSRRDQFSDFTNPRNTIGCRMRTEQRLCPSAICAPKRNLTSRSRGASTAALPLFRPPERGRWASTECQAPSAHPHNGTGRVAWVVPEGASHGYI